MQILYRTLEGCRTSFNIAESIISGYKGLLTSSATFDLLLEVHEPVFPQDLMKLTTNNDVYR